MPFDLNPLIDSLRAQSEPEYAELSRSLIPGTGASMLGVRIPALRTIARNLLRGDWRGFLEASRTHPIFEIRMLHGMVLGGARCDIAEKIELTDRFLPHVSDWSVCDGFCTSFKPRASDLEALFPFVRACAESESEFRARFGLVMLMSRFHDEPWLGRAMAVYRGFHHDAYYARMGAAWGLATLYLYDREGALDILRDRLWDDFTHNKAIQKICESFRVSNEDKTLVRDLRVPVKRG